MSETVVNVTTERPVSVMEDTGTWIAAQFANREEAERAYELLRERGYENNEINLLMTEETRHRYFQQDTQETALQEKANETKLDKAASGAMKGAMIGTLLAAGSNMVLPGVGLFLGGPLFIGLGAIAGGLKTFLAESGFTEAQAASYESAVQEGRIVIGLKTHNQEDAEYFRRQWAGALLE
ncbi:MAG TPA: hypothetical protein VFZ34_26045 [Blastocatellia bacterium]|nr:hypothetical protein [Blastocatellia bacterium]